jgi:hypothetical protein
VTDAARARDVGRRPFRGRVPADSTWPLWASLVGAPAAWALAILASYVLVPVSCELGTRLPLHGVRLVTTAAALGAAWAAFGLWRETRGSEGARVRRTAFLAAIGVGIALFSALLIVLEGIANFVVDPCR